MQEKKIYGAKSIAQIFQKYEKEKIILDFKKLAREERSKFWYNLSFTK